MSNGYTYSVPFTEEELYDSYVAGQMSQQEIAEKYGTTQKVVWRAMHKMGVPTRIAAKRNQSGPLNSTWRGGRILQATTKKQRGERTAFGSGYYYLLLPDHPNATKTGYIAEHIVVATEERGCPLAQGEMVHHINLNKHDNRPENLAITTAKEHSLWHNQLEEMAVMLLLHTGNITFIRGEGYCRSR